MNSLFERYQDQLDKNPHKEGTRRAEEWDRRVFAKEKSIEGLLSVTRGFRTVRRLRPGILITYYYRAKTKNLTYWDKHPLVYVTDIHKDGWSGINIHYLSPDKRNTLMLEKNFRTRTSLEENMLKSATKRYSEKQVIGRVVEIPPEDWKIAINLPFENFVGTAKESVWNDSRSKK